MKTNSSSRQFNSSTFIFGVGNWVLKRFWYILFSYFWICRTKGNQSHDFITVFITQLVHMCSLFLCSHLNIQFSFQFSPVVVIPLLQSRLCVNCNSIGSVSAMSLKAKYYHPHIIYFSFEKVKGQLWRFQKSKSASLHSPCIFSWREPWQRHRFAKEV